MRCQGYRAFSLGLQHQAQVGVVRGVIAAQRDRPLDHPHREIRSACAEFDHPQQMEAVAMANVNGQDLQV